MLQIESNASMIVRLVEELLSISRNLKESWILGQLPKTEPVADVTKGIDEKVNVVLEKILQSKHFEEEVGDEYTEEDEVEEQEEEQEQEQEQEEQKVEPKAEPLQGSVVDVEEIKPNVATTEVKKEKEEETINIKIEEQERKIEQSQEEQPQQQQTQQQLQEQKQTQDSDVVMDTSQIDPMDIGDSMNGLGYNFDNFDEMAEDDDMMM